MTTRNTPLTLSRLAGRTRHVSAGVLATSMCLLAACDGALYPDDIGGIPPDSEGSLQPAAEARTPAPAPAPSQRAASSTSMTTSAATTSPESGWSQTGSLASDRILHTATKLQDGRVLVLGGYNASVELYSPATGTWSATSNAPGNYRGAAAVLLSSGQVLVTGAASSGVSAALFDPASGTWTATGSLATPRYYHTATKLQDGRVLVLGGANSEYGGTTLASAELYDPATGTWTATSALNTARSHHTATLLSSGKVLVTGGQDASGRLASAELYDPATGTWTTASAPSTARANHAATLLASGKVLVTGGGLDGAPAATSELYDPATGSWSAAPSMSQPRRLHSATLLPSGKVLVTGGFDTTTGIQSGTELYDPERNVWDAMPSMAVARYQHTATVLDGGQVLVAGGFSEGSQASAELFSAAYVQIVLDEGPGWQLVNVSSASTDSGVQPYNTNLYIVGSESGGIDNAPLPAELRQELAQEAAGEDALFLIDQKLLEQYAAQQSAAGAQGVQASLFDCPADEPKVWSKTLNFVSFLDQTQALGEGFTGTLGTSGQLQANATGELHTVLKFSDAFFCVPYVEFDHFRLNGHGALDFGANLNGSLSYARSWEFDIVKPHLGSFSFMAGPIPVHLGINLPVTAGINLQATLNGELSYSANQSVSVDFNTKCTLKGCESTTSVNVPDIRDPYTDGQLQGRIKPSVWAQAAVRLYLYDEKFAYAQIGVRPYLDGDLWGYVGSECGDADGNGADELVSATTFGLDWRINVTGEVSALDALGVKPKRFDEIWTTGPQYIGFWDLIPGGSTALRPMLTGQATTGQYNSTPYQLKMRPCWPYGDTMLYQLDWGDGFIEYPSAAPQSALTMRHAWSTGGSKPVKAIAVRDTHGRNLGNSTFERTIQVTPQPPPPVPAEYFREVSVTGRLDLLDFEVIGPDPKKTQWINDVVYLDPTTRQATLRYVDCVGDEVRAEVDLYLTLQDDNVTVVAQAYGRLFEQESCDNNDLEATAQSESVASRDGNTQLGFQMVNTEWPTPDSASLDITVTNNQKP